MACCPVFKGTRDVDRYGLHGSFDCVECWFFHKEMIYYSPGRGGPAVVELPHERSATGTRLWLSPRTAPAAVRIIHGFRLDKLRKVHPVL